METFNSIDKTKLKLDCLTIVCQTDTEYLEDDGRISPDFFNCLYGIEAKRLILADEDIVDPNENREIYASNEGEFYEDLGRF